MYVNPHVHSGAHILYAHVCAKLRPYMVRKGCVVGVWYDDMDSFLKSIPAWWVWGGPNISYFPLALRAACRLM